MAISHLQTSEERTLFRDMLGSIIREQSQREEGSRRVD